MTMTTSSSVSPCATKTASWSNCLLHGSVLLRIYPPPHFLHVLLSTLLLVGVVGSVPGLEYDLGSHPKFVCTPIPADADPSCFTPGDSHSPGSHGNSHGNGHGNSHGNGHGNGHHGPMMGHGISDEAKTTILHLRESLVRQKETILDQRETIRELTAKLTLCEGFGRGAGGHHDDDHHGPGHHGPYHGSTHHYDDHHTNHHTDHHTDHHSSHHTDHHTDPHYPINNHRLDHQRGKGPYMSHHGFSPEQTGKTLQALKEKLDALQARNSSSTYSNSLRDLLQRRINLLEEQLHHYHGSHYNHGNHDNHHTGSSHSNHHDDHHDTHHDDHHDTHHDNHHSNHHDNHHETHGGHHDDHHYDRHSHRYDRHNSHHGDHHDTHHDSHYDDHHGGHHDEHHDDHHGSHHDDHHDDQHGNGHHDDGHHEDHGHGPRTGLSKLAPRGPPRGTHAKLDSVLSQLHHHTEPAGHGGKPKNPDAFQIGFPMRSNYMYGRIKRTLLNEIFALTVCLWLKGGSGPGIGTPFSYSVPGQANELVLIEWGNNPMELLVNDKAVTLPLAITDSKWHHLCITWSTRDGVWEAYQDGVKRGSGESLSAWHPIKPGGVFILGQEQDTLGGRFDATQSFVGEMSDLQLWSRVLTPQEINNQASCRSHLTGDIITWMESVVELHGGVTKYPFDPCH